MGRGLFFIAALVLISNVVLAQTEISNESKSTTKGLPLLNQPILPYEPLDAIKPQIGSKQIAVHVRFINHGLKVDSGIIDRLLYATEKIYDSCAGVEFKIINEGIVKAPKTLLQQSITTTNNGNIFVTKDFFSFFGPYSATKPQGVIDIHLVDHLAASAREEVKNHKPITIKFLGQGFSDLTHAFLDNRPENQRNPPLSFFENNVVIAHDTIKATEGEIHGTYAPGSGPLPNQPHKLQKFSRSYSNYLLAHELGHVLMDRLTPEGYKDHFCPGLGVFCPQEYLMSAGGFDYTVYFNPNDKKNIIGYGPAPTVDPQQCENLRAHPYIVK